MLYKKGLNELSALLSEGKTSSKEISQSLLKRINEKDKNINSYITVDEKLLLKQAAESDSRRSAGKPLSVFDGIPVAVKDNINTEGVRTTCASRILENFVPHLTLLFMKRCLTRG